MKQLAEDYLLNILDYLEMDLLELANLILQKYLSNFM